MTIHLFGKTDSPCIAAWALQEIAADNEDAFGEEISEIVKNFYADDSSFLKPLTEQGVHSPLELMRMSYEGNFHPTKFISNNKDLYQQIPNTADWSGYIERALRQQWNIDNDTFGIKTLPPSGRSSWYDWTSPVGNKKSLTEDLAAKAPLG